MRKSTKKLTPLERIRAEEEEKKRKREAEAAVIYQEFVKSFEQDENDNGDDDHSHDHPSKSPKNSGLGVPPPSNNGETRKVRGMMSFVRGGKAFTANQPNDESSQDSDEGQDTAPQKKKMYLPPKISAGLNNNHANSTVPTSCAIKQDQQQDHRASKKDNQDKKNIDTFLEELKKEQQERERLGTSIPPPQPQGAPKKGSYDIGDPLTTNLFVGNLAPTTDEAKLQRYFGDFGPIGSVKIMWPWKPEEFERGHNSGFVSFMEREDAQAAFDKSLKDGITIDGNELRIEWGKAVSRPPHPLPPLQGQEYGGSAKKEKAKDHIAEAADSTKVAYNVIPPLNLVRRREIDILAMYVARYGHKLEGMIVDRERTSGRDTRFKFLFDPSGPNTDEFTYYRWRVYSLCQGDKEKQWRTVPFAMYEGGPLWIPPTCSHPINNPGVENDQERQALKVIVQPKDGFQDGKEEDVFELVAKMDEELTQTDSERLISILRSLTTTHDAIGDAMYFCMRRTSCAGDLASIISESLILPETPMSMKIARLYLISDMLFNSSNFHLKNAWALRSRFEMLLPRVFQGLHETFIKIDGFMASKTAQAQVDRVLMAWEKWSLYAPESIENYRSILLKGPSVKDQDGHGDKSNSGVLKEESEQIDENQRNEKNKSREQLDEREQVTDLIYSEEDIDGESVDSDYVDSEVYEENIDKEPMEGDKKLAMC